MVEVGQSWSLHSWLSWLAPGHCEVRRPSLAREPGPPSQLLSLVLLPGPQEVEHWLQGLQEVQAEQGPAPQVSSSLASPSQVPPLVRGLQALSLLLPPPPQVTLQAPQGPQEAQP